MRTVTSEYGDQIRFSPGKARWVANNADDILLLFPEPPENVEMATVDDYWTVVEVGLSPYGTFLHESINRNALVRGRRGTVRPGKESTHEYVTEPDVYHRAQAVIEGRDPTREMPCGHAGMKTISMDPPTYSCGARACDETFDREETKRALGLR